MTKKILGGILSYKMTNGAIRLFCGLELTIQNMSSKAKPNPSRETVPLMEVKLTRDFPAHPLDGSEDIFGLGICPGVNT